MRSTTQPAPPAASVRAIRAIRARRPCPESFALRARAAARRADTAGRSSEGASLKKRRGERRDRDRDAKVVAAYAEGGLDTTLRSVARKVGLGPERVRQIILRWEAETGKPIPRTPERRRTAKRRAEEARKRMRPPTVAQRLLARVRVKPETDCWEWVGPFSHLSGRVYARFEALGEQFAHRVAFRLWRGLIPPRHIVLQSCDGSFCLNPFHLVARSRAEAARVWNARSTPPPPQTHCKRGHALTPGNVVWNTSSKIRDGVRTTVRTRLCRICDRERHRRSYKKPPRRPPLPLEQHERDLEMIIRRVENAKVADRAAVLWRELERTKSEPVEVPALEDEPWEDYRERNGRRGLFTDWQASRILSHPRVTRALGGGRGRKPRPDAERT